MTTEGVDYANPNVPASLLVSHGARFAGRYVSEPGNPKNLRQAEVAALGKEGIRIVTIGETTAQRANEGMAAGTADAKSFAEQAAALGQPKGSAIYYAVDFNTTPDNINNVLHYFDGVRAAAVPYAIGAYGSYNTVVALHSHGLADFL